MGVGAFDKIEWSHSEAKIGDVVFDLASAAAGYPADTTASRPRLIKDRHIVGDYERVFAAADISAMPRMFELGLWDGGSAIFWSELLNPAIYIGIDRDTRGDSEVFRNYAAHKQGILTEWGVSQTDRRALCRLIGEHDAAPLDLVVDDASHQYEPTKASFEILFPFLRPGGLYLIEDWAWAHWPGFALWAGEAAPTRLVVELIEAAGTGREVIRDVTVEAGLVAVTRGPAALDQTFTLSTVTSRRHVPSVLHRVSHLGRRSARRAVRR